MSETISRPVKGDRVAVANVFGPLAPVFKPLAVLLAGRKAIPFWAIVRHRGRRSGRLRLTPVAVGWRDDALYVPLPFGTRADWCRNVVAAGGCTVRWKGNEWKMSQPEVVPEAAARDAFNAIERTILTMLGIRAFLRLRFLHQASDERSQGLHERVSP